MTMVRTEELVRVEMPETEVVEVVFEHPSEWALRRDRLPHIWCSGCGIGIAVNAFVAARRNRHGLPSRGKADFHGYSPIPPDGRRLPRTDFGATGH